MFVEVPAPPWITSTRKCSWCRPFRTSAAALTITAQRSSSSNPISELASAAASFTAASAASRAGNSRITTPVMGKFSIARSVWIP